MKRILCSAFVCVFSLVAYARPQQPPHLSDSEISHQTAKRAPLRKKWTDDARRLAQKTDDEKAKALVNILMPQMRLGCPTENGAAFLEHIDHNSRWFFFIPFAAAELNRGKWKDINVGSLDEMSAFLPLLRSIIVHDQKEMKPQWRGMMLLHQMFLVDEYFKHPSNGMDFRLNMEMKARAYDFTFRLMEKLGGKKYQAYLNSQAERLHNAITTGALTDGMKFTQPKEYAVKLKKFFGKPASEREMSLRVQQFWVALCFRMMEKDRAVSQAQRMKVDFLMLLQYQRLTPNNLPLPQLPQPEKKPQRQTTGPVLAVLVLLI